ncbi:TIGR00730 family Rossman fold protein [soil metagenome]
MASELKTVCVYCGSSPGFKPEYRSAAYAFGAYLAGQGITTVYGGGNVGLMGAVADGALSAHGRVVGVIPRALMDKELGHPALAELIVVESMHERKLEMARRADAFVALPGGIGTFEEIFEVLTWTQLGFHLKPCAFLNVEGFYTPLIAFLEQVAAQGFLRKEHLATVVVDTDMARLVTRLAAYEHVDYAKWRER